MKSNEARSSRVLSLLADRIRLFYILALAPLPLIFYYSPFSAVIPFYAFLLLLLKSQELTEFKETHTIQKLLGSIVIACSFFVYYLTTLVYTEAAFYTPANYTIYLFGLFLIFFELAALKEAFAPLFLIVAATSSSFIAAWLKPFLAPFANDFAHIIVNILRALGINADIYSGRIAGITFESLSGRIISGAFVYECMGVYSALVFSIILVVILFEDPSGWKARLAYSLVGILGTFALNILRVTIIFLADYFYGAEVGGTIHYVIGYALFSAWLAFFLYIYSKREALHARVKSVFQGMRKMRGRS